MEFLDFFVLALVIVGVSVVAVVRVLQKNQSIQRASAPPEAGVTQNDTPAEVIAKVHTYNQVQEAVRIFHSIIDHDNYVPVLNDQEREDIEAYLAAFYHKPHDKK